MGKKWFTDEKRLSVETTRNTQNDRAHAAVYKKKETDSAQLLQERNHFSEPVRISIGASHDSKTFIFKDHGVKIK